MGMVVSGIVINYCGATSATEVFTLLLEAGWQFSSGEIHYDHYRQVHKMGIHAASANEDRWEEVRSLLAERMKAKERVSVILQWENTSVIGKFLLSKKKKWTKLHVILYATRPHLRGNVTLNREAVSEAQPQIPVSFETDYDRKITRFTDFSWLLERILDPLIRRGYDVLEVTCSDDNY